MLSPKATTFPRFMATSSVGGSRFRVGDNMMSAVRTFDSLPIGTLDIYAPHPILNLLAA